jgi:preprotein translocase subunit YajC
MPGPPFDIALLFAQGAAGAGAKGADTPTWSYLLLYAPIFLLFYVLLIRPGQQAERKRRELINALKKNDRVLTQAGIYGTVVSIHPDGDRVVLRVDDDRGVKMEFSKASIARVVDPAADKEKEKAEAV